MNFDWHTLLGIGASILLLALLVPYIKSIVSSTTRPSAVSWFGWSLLFAITAAAQASKGVDWSIAVPVISFLSTTVIAFTALRLGRAVWTRIDIFCITIALIAIVLWVVTKEPLTAIILSMVADFAVTIPTIVKTYQDPKSEPMYLWILYVVGVAMEIGATQELTVYNLLFPTYTFFGATIIAALASRHLRTL